MARRRRLMYDVDPRDLGFSSGWTVSMPSAWDRAAGWVLVRLYADPPGPTADGWEALWFAPPENRAHDSYRHVDRDVVMRWVRATRVEQVLLEDAETRQFAPFAF